MKSRTKWMIYGAGALVLLLTFFYFTFRGTNNWKTKLPVMGFVQPFVFVNQFGDTVTEKQVEGKIYLANYFFVTCTGVCPNMNGKLKTIYEKYKGRPDIVFLSHTCQPENDSLPALRKYMEDMEADGKQWQFLTGNKLDLYKMARESYRIDDPKNNVGSITDQFLHSQFLALVDKMGRVRGVYDGLKMKEVNRLTDDIELVMQETDAKGVLDKVFGNETQPPANGK